MKEKELYNEILEKQKKFDDDQRTDEAEEIIKNAEESILNNILVQVNGEQAQRIQDAFNEYRAARVASYEAKGGETRLEDVEKLVPDNLWINLVYKNKPAKEFELPSFKEIQIELLKDAIKKKKGIIKPDSVLN
jgi:hypothetical protein